MGHREAAERDLHRAAAESPAATIGLAQLALDDVASRRVSRPTLAEQLTDREAAVLSFLPTMMSNHEIASELFVSVNTVKTHLRSIYRKLGANDRRDAVQRARDLHLLAPGLARRG